MARICAAALVDACFPPLCRVCGAWMERGKRDAVCICHGCWDSIPRIAPPYCLRCGVIATPEAAHTFRAANWSERNLLSRFDPDPAAQGQPWPGAICRACRDETPPFTVARGHAPYDGVLAEAVHIFKYQPRASMRKPLGALLRSLASRHSGLLAGDPVVVPVPIHSARRRERGFNQAELLAAELVDGRGGIEVSFRALRRTRMTARQADLPHEKRLENVAGVYAADREAERISGRPVLLVDDVVTTGATVSECARVLTAAGAAEVRVMCLARGVLGAVKNRPGHNF